MIVETKKLNKFKRLKDLKEQTRSVINSENILGTSASILMKDLQVKVKLDSENIPIGKDKYSHEEMKKKKELEE